MTEVRKEDPRARETHALRGPISGDATSYSPKSAVSSVRATWSAKKCKLGSAICTNASTNGSKLHVGKRPCDEPTQREELQHHLATGGYSRFTLDWPVAMNISRSGGIGDIGRDRR